MSTSADPNGTALPSGNDRSGSTQTFVKRHAHEFSALYWHFGPYGRQDVHVHSCRPWDDGDRCERVLIGEGRECDGDPTTHHRETLHG